ncbi:hypothetical protein UT300009_30640 [Paraclostridium bifermentans]
MEMLKESIENMYSKGLKINEVSRLLQIKVKKLREIMLDLDIYPNENDKEYDYFRQAKIIKMQLSSAYFVKDLVKLTGISKSRVQMVCKMYDLKPCKKAHCVICGKEIEVKGSVVKQYCSSECYYEVVKEKRKQSKPAVKTCVSCGATFEGKTNSKFCSDRCRQHDKEVKESIKWLNQL